MPGEWKSVSERTARKRGTQYRFGWRASADEPEADIRETFAVLLDLAERSVELRLPMKLDF